MVGKLEFQVAEPGVHGSQDFDCLGCGDGLVFGQLAEVCVDEAHEAEAAEGDDFSRVVTYDVQVITEWFAHALLIDAGVAVAKHRVQKSRCVPGGERICGGSEVQGPGGG